MNKEETVMVDLDKIASGEEPDFFIKPKRSDQCRYSPDFDLASRAEEFFQGYIWILEFVYDRNFGNLDAGKPWTACRVVLKCKLA